jgi:hypothetical protein
MHLFTYKTRIGCVSGRLSDSSGEKWWRTVPRDCRGLPLGRRCKKEKHPFSVLRRTVSNAVRHIECTLYIALLRAAMYVELRTTANYVS